MKTIEKYKISFIMMLVFILLVASTLTIYSTPKYTKARDYVEYLNSDLGKLSVTIEESSNELLGKNESSAKTEWNNKLNQAKRELNKWETLCIILGSLSIISLGISILSFLEIKGKIKTAFFNPDNKVKKEKITSQSTNPIQAISNADELKKYKELLGEGIITQEEFDAKKKQLLGL